MKRILTICALMAVLTGCRCQVAQPGRLSADSTEYIVTIEGREAAFPLALRSENTLLYYRCENFTEHDTLFLDREYNFYRYDTCRETELTTSNYFLTPRTNSNHVYRKYPNLVKGLEVRHVNHVWVADITYVWIEGDVLYLHLVTDAFSHAVIGWCLTETLEADGTVRALEMAIETAGGGNLCATIHHSDRGSQYACYRYVDTLVGHHIRISMTECYKPTDNAVAERMNGILKVEWIYHRELFANYREAEQGIADMIHFYNHIRPHMSIEPLQTLPNNQGWLCIVHCHPS